VTARQRSYFNSLEFKDLQSNLAGTKKTRGNPLAFNSFSSILSKHISLSFGNHATMFSCLGRELY
jgi:hypothetical protein